MTDDPILDTVRTGLAAAHMSRPVDDIVRRARARRRARAFTAGASVALCATLALVALPPDRGAPLAAGSPAPQAASASPSLHPVGFTLTQTADGTYTFDVVPGVPLDLAAVERSLDQIGITARVTVDEVCKGQHSNLTWNDFDPNRKDGRHFLSFVTHRDHTVSIKLDGRHFPATALSIRLVLNDKGQLTGAVFALYATGGKWDCHTLPSAAPGK